MNGIKEIQCTDNEYKNSNTFNFILILTSAWSARLPQNAVETNLYVVAG